MYTWILVFLLFLKNRNIISKIKRSNVTYYAALKETMEVSNKAKIRNRYNQVPHLTQDTTWESRT